MTGYLAAIYRLAPLPGQWAAEIEKVLQQTGTTAILDLCSGSAGPMPLVAEALRKRGCPASVTLTDLYLPSHPHAQPGILYWPQPVDARSVPPTLSGMRTMFAAFHHFRPADARNILQSAVNAGEPIAIFEATSRHPATVLSSVFIPLLTLVLTPAVRPVSWRQLLLTYVIPILPLLIFWDGLVSHLRTYTRAEMEELARQCTGQPYHWTTGALPATGVPGGLPFLTGTPPRTISWPGGSIERFVNWWCEADLIEPLRPNQFAWHSDQSANHNGVQAACQASLECGKA